MIVCAFGDLTSSKLAPTQLQLHLGGAQDGNFGKRQPRHFELEHHRVRSARHSQHLVGVRDRIDGMQSNPRARRLTVK